MYIIHLLNNQKMNGRTYGTTELRLPAFKSNIPNDRVFSNVSKI